MARIPNEGLRRAVQESDMSLSAIARELGWMTPDTSRVSRALGISKGERRRVSEYTSSIDEELAEKIRQMIGADPIDVGL
jgi:hypothetical protein